jgi:hypothetical protein
MDFGLMLDDSFTYAKEGIWERWSRWLVLIGCMIIFPLILGYMVRIYRGEKPAPEPGEWATLFVDGMKLLAVYIVYWTPVILLLLLALIPFIMTLVSAGVFSDSFSAMSEPQFERWMDNHPELISQLLLTGGFMALLIFIAVILAIVITFLSFIGIVRFARTNSISEAFNFSEIIAHIGRIGWINYIIALITISVIGYIFGTILNFFSFIPVIGIFVELFLTGIFYVPFILFSARFSALVYNAGEEGSLKSSDAPNIPPFSQ